MKIQSASSWIAGLACLLLLGAGSAAAQQSVTLTLGGAARLAAAQSAGTEAARYRVDMAEARLRQQRADLLPTLAGTLSQNERTLNSAGFGLALRDPTTGNDLFDPGGAYDPGVPDYHFGTMLAGAADAIRLWSTRPIVAGGLASGNPLYLQGASDAAGGLPTDAVGIHPYGQRAPDDWPDPSWGFGNMSALFDAYLVFGQPLWVTEIGTIDEPLQADYLENVYTLAAGPYAGLVPVVLWFCWSDAMVPPFGVLYADGTPKPSFDRYRAVAPPWDDACDGVD